MPKRKKKTNIFYARLKAINKQAINRQAADANTRSTQ
jgi:hypothetical protein